MMVEAVTDPNTMIEEEKIAGIVMIEELVVALALVDIAMEETVVMVARALIQETVSVVAIDQIRLKRH